MSEHLASLNALFIECKIIDDNKRMSLYLKNGISRYIDGQYAWSMRHSVMIAYVKNSKGTDDLKSYLHNEGDKDWESNKVGVHSSHCRNWQYTRKEYGEGFQPGKIKLLHIWLKV
jgi:hypothetical protein